MYRRQFRAWHKLAGELRRKVAAKAPAAPIARAA